jgi:hypothetical protein
MHPISSKRSLFAVCIVTIAGIAATPGRAGADDGGIGDDAGLDAALDAAPDAMPSTADASPTPDATIDMPDATPTPTSSGSGPMADDGAVPTYTGGNIYQALCIDDPTIADPTAKPFVFANVQPAYTTPAACKMFDAQGHTSVHNCYCDSCFSAMQQCDSLPGCRAILKCELDKGCTDPTSCYFTACGTIIDKWANTSTASFLTYLLEQCGKTNNCPTQ